MNRIRLLWFAAGAAASALVAVASALLVSPKEAAKPYLVVSEPRFNQILADGPNEQSWHSAEIARDCGARVFEMVPETAMDATDYTLVPVTPANLPATQCIIERATKAGLHLDVVLSTDSGA